MARPSIKTIRASSHPLGTGDFTTIQAWEDYADDKVNPYQWAECYSGFDLGTFTLSGWSSTPTSSGYPRIYAASGELHNGNLNTGPIISPGETTDVNTIGVNYAKVDGLGSTRGFHMDIDTASNMTIENCWATSKSDFCFKARSSVGSTSSSGNVIKNCLAIGTTQQDVGFELGGSDMVNGRPGISCYNCTAYAHKNSCYRLFNTKLPGFYGGADVTVVNCIGAGSTGADFSFIDGGNGSFVFTNNMASDTTSAQYGENNFYYQNAETVFKNPDKSISITSDGGVVQVSSPGDFRLKANSKAINHGASISSILTDIRLMPRPFGSNYDMGAYEYGGFPHTIPLYISGPATVTSGVSLTVFSPPISSGVSPFFIKGGANPHSSGIPLHLQAQSVRLASTLFLTGDRKVEKRNLTILGHYRTTSSGIESTRGTENAHSLYMKVIGRYETIPMHISPHAPAQSTPTLFMKVIGRNERISLSHIGHKTAANWNQYIRNDKFVPTQLYIKGFTLHGIVPMVFASGIPYDTINSLGSFPTPTHGEAPHHSLFVGGRGPQLTASLSMPNTKGLINAAASLYTIAPIPINSGVPLNIGNFVFKRKEPLFVEGKDPRRIFGSDSIVYASGIDNYFTLHLQGLINTGSISASTRLPDSSGLPRTSSMFYLDTDLANTNTIGLNTQGYSGITAPNSVAFFRSDSVDSSDFIPTKSQALLFAGSERNCVDGSLYKFKNNTNDNSSDYNFKLYASGFYAGGAGYGDVTPMLESGFYQTSTRFPASSSAGSGVARFVGGTTAGIKMINNNTYYGTVLMQSGSPSIHDQHRITPTSGEFVRRGVAASFWINKSKGRTKTGLTAIQGVMGNLELQSFRYAASGQWGIYNVSSPASASGTTPFNSLKSFVTVNDDGVSKVDGASEHLGGILPYVNTTAGGSLGKLLKTHDGELIEATVPDTMIPLTENRWYYIQFWVDTTLKSSYVRVASPAKGIPGQSGYFEEIKPITDKCQKWDGYEVKTDTDDLKFKVGGNLWRNQGNTPYYNLGYNIGSDLSSAEEFLIDEITVSNKVCSIAAMEEQFDLNYKNFTSQFLATNQSTLFVSGFEQDPALPVSGVIQDLLIFPSG